MASSADEIFADLQDQFEKQARAGEYDPALDEFMDNEVVPVYRGNYPVETGEGRDSVKVTKRASGGKGQVGATDEAAHVIEYGSEDTPEFAPLAKTVAHFESPTN